MWSLRSKPTLLLIYVLTDAEPSNAVLIRIAGGPANPTVAGIGIQVDACVAAKRLQSSTSWRIVNAQTKADE